MTNKYNQSQFSDSLKNFNINQVGLQQAEHNYFIKYGNNNSGYSQMLTKPLMKKQQQKTHQIQTISMNKKITSNQNQVLRQLKQQYQILKNLPIHTIDNTNINVKNKTNIQYNKNKHQQQKQSYSNSNSNLSSQQSQYTSSSKNHHNQYHNNKRYSKDAQILLLQKKQLQIVINNSMKKIQQLLTNQMQLKKNIHQLKLQIQGKGGINSQYQLNIRNYKKNQKQFTQNINALKQQIEKKNQFIKQLSEKIAFYEGQKSKRQQIQRNYFQEQRQMDNIIRNQKDKTMNAQMQLRRLQMQFEIYQKDKNSQINRLIKQLQFNQSLPNNEIDSIKRLKQQLQTKQYKIQQLNDQIQQLRLQSSNIRPRQSDSNKKQIKAKNESTSNTTNQLLTKTLIQKISTQRESILKNQLSTLKLEVDNIRKNSQVSEYPLFNSQHNYNQDQQQLKYKLKQLEKVVQQQKKQKRQLYDDVQKLRKQRDQVIKQLQSHKRKIRQYKQIQQQLLNQIQQLNVYKVQLDQSKHNNSSRIQQKVNKIRANYDLQQSLVQRQFYSNQNNQSYQDQIRILRRKIDQLTFALQKATQQKTQTQTLIRQQKQIQLSGVLSDVNRYKSLLKQKQSQITLITQGFKQQIQLKNNQITQLTSRLTQLQQTHKNLLQNSKTNYQQLLKSQQQKHLNQIQSMNQKIIQLTKTVQNFSTKTIYYSTLQREIIQLRRLTKNTKRITQTIDHLWEIKQAEYGNINQIFNNIHKA